MLRPCWTVLCGTTPRACWLPWWTKNRCVCVCVCVCTDGHTCCVHVGQCFVASYHRHAGCLGGSKTGGCMGVCVCVCTDGHTCCVHVGQCFVASYHRHAGCLGGPKTGVCACVCVCMHLWSYMLRPCWTVPCGFIPQACLYTKHWHVCMCL